MPRNSRSDRRRSRSDKRSLASLLPRAFPEELRARLAPEVDSYVREVKFDMENRTLDVGGPQLATNSAHRTAMDIIPRIMGAVGTEGAIERFLERANCHDEGEALLLIARGRMSGEADLELSCQRAVDLFRRRMAVDPGYRRTLLWELFGIREVEPERAALPPAARPATNGASHDTEHTNGNGSPS